ncbi:MAG: hypothetical protein LBD05_00460 [Mycoplasmataceae bacterium]|jgi:putative peptide zinc metalloprotease protein|nr:hypothetical protein [Mycoplasmataceae bacterium]
MLNTKKTEIYSTDFQGKNLVISENYLFYCNDIIKDIILLFKENKNINEITNEINDRYLTDYKPINIKESLAQLDKYGKRKKITFPHIDLFDSQNVALPKINYTTNKKTFIVILLSFFVNMIYVISFNAPSIYNYERILIFFLLIIILFGHELGHAFYAKQYNITAGKIGIGLYFLVFPVLYITINQIWRLSKEKRIIINCGGIIFQSLIGTILIICNLYFNNGVTFYLIKANFIVMCLNLNPLLKFDGYWILSDYLNDRKLYNNSQLLIKNWLRLKFEKITDKKLLIYSFFRLLFILFIFYCIISVIVNVISCLI